MQQSFIDILSRGERLATGLEAPLGIRSVREIISPELWSILEADFDESELIGPHTEIVQVEVLSKEASEKLYPLSAGPDLVPIIKTAPDTQELITLSDDDRQLTIAGKTYLVRGEIQQVILRRLVDALPSGRKLVVADLLKFAGANANSLQNAFKGSPHYEPMKKHLRVEGGLCWLESKP
ncbi:hypothetical protein [Hansschlegelia sp.]|uniref:hypothetical protein n=1 Tax=Hansschlegelia sp. TaxID=2041892 RepID=UPI002BAF69D4|nr:hypothetical protein [Hansschlegelia sp.]HVI27285.1 hypothetical protein [Hansschlegelia sp.]